MNFIATKFQSYCKTLYIEQEGKLSNIESITQQRLQPEFTDKIDVHACMVENKAGGAQQFLHKL